MIRSALPSILVAVGLVFSPAADAWEQCFAEAGARFKVNPLLLRAIARQESGMRPDAVNTNKNGTRDLGVMQINTWWLDGPLREAGITEEALFQPCLNIHVGAWVLANEIQRHGMSWKAIGAYHSPTEWRQNDYAVRIQRHLIRELRALGQDIPMPPAPARVPTPPVELAQASTTAIKPAGGVWEAESGQGVDAASRPKAEVPEGGKAGG